MTLTYLSTSAPRVELHSFLFFISETTHSVFTLLSLRMSTAVVVPVEYIYGFKGAASFAESGVLVSLPPGVYVFFADAVLLSVLQRSQSDIKEVYLFLHRIRDVGGKDEAGVAWFPYVGSRGNVLDISARKVKTA